MGDDLGVAGVGRLAAEHDRRPLRAAEDLVEQRQLQLAVALPAELGAEVGRPQPLAAHLLLQRVDDLAAGVVERRELQAGPHQVERLDLLPHERVDPVQLRLELGLGLEIPRHCAPGRWVEGVMSQAADEDIAATTLAVLWNGGTLSDSLGASRPSPSAPLAALLREPFAALGSSDPDLDASLAAHATFGQLTDFLWRRARPTRSDIDHIIEFCVGAVTARA